MSILKKTFIRTVEIINVSFEDIMWVRFDHKLLHVSINVCVCNLSPEGASCQADPHAFFDKLLAQIYIYQDSGPFIICGDINSRWW